MEYEKFLDASEIKTRKRWLFFLIFSLCVSIVALLFDLLESVSDTKVRPTPIIVMGFIKALGQAFVEIAMFSIFKYCTYKNPGTRLLTLGLILSPFSVAVIIGAIFLVFTVIPPELSPVKYIVLAIGFLLLWFDIYMIVLNYRVRKINKKIKKHIALQKLQSEPCLV
jgi:hypothetical protein